MRIVKSLTITTGHSQPVPDLVAAAGRRGLGRARFRTGERHGGRISVFRDRQQPCDADRVPAARAVRAANPKGFLFGRGAARSNLPLVEAQQIKTARRTAPWTSRGLPTSGTSSSVTAERTTNSRADCMRCSTCTSRPVDCPCRSAGCKCFLTRRTIQDPITSRQSSNTSRTLQRSSSFALRTPSEAGLSARR